MKKSIYRSLGVSIIYTVAGSIVWAILTNYIYPAITAQAIKFSSSFNNKVFINVSYHDLVALQQSTYMTLAVGFVSAYIILFSAFYYAMLHYREEYENSKNKLYDFKEKVFGTAAKEDDITEEDLKQRIENSIKDAEENDKFYRKAFLAAKYILPLSMIFFVLSSAYSTLSTKYVYESISYFDYLLKVNADNLDDRTEREYMTRFTQIRNSQDYKNIVIELENRAFSCGRSILPNPTVRKNVDMRKDHPGIKSVYAGER
ncbi:hypothetical protein [Acinetobacter seifertii]|uniref:hypothetical protein n=2 Tax=Acinetobacter calcoaceticus/baumannii complex TaxID=909768 RepID=UPI0015802DB8|nr:hypothetical protein [Acinetobacter seifertii]NUF84663.1 hypothetical protein [Acinetobacter seifertii]